MSEKIVYNNSGYPVSTDAEELLSLGLNFSTYSFCRLLCNKLECNKTHENQAKAQKIRNIATPPIGKQIEIEIKPHKEAVNIVKQAEKKKGHTCCTGRQRKSCRD